MLIKSNKLFAKFTTSCLALVCLLYTHSIYGKEFLIAVGLTKPPYVIQETNKGFELELITAICKKMQKQCRFVHTEFGHSVKMLQVEQIDAVMTASKQVFSGQAHLSTSYITYQNVAISLKERNLDIQSIADLGKLSIASFQSAHKVLGKEFAQAAQDSPMYLQIAIQKQQPLLLLKKRVDVIVIDINIFKYLIKSMALGDIDSQFNIHPVFPPSKYHMAFKDEQLKDAFNSAFKFIQQSEDYQKLKVKYDFH